MVTLHTTFGDIKIQLNSEKAPETSANFLQYCRDGFYNGTLFHRVIDGFMIQGGGMASGMVEKETRDPIKNEASNGLSNKTGTIAMARTMEPHSASSQFFINVNDNNFLDFKSETPDGWGYCVFGEVVEGMDVVNKIKAVATGNWGYVHQDVPVEEVVINSVTIEE
ncbi:MULTISPECIES: peptidylprolyl isomerase [unclassified Photobacterium]|uniref:peptidylprolyl isomerase n=1 Tax=unclassified Photobacterium TaxID=2628852 RepID=UPI001B8AEAD9|nr:MULTISPECIES: peptidylprolyl isomerase [unclassified Photobacterium]MDO6705698.1 peptidylprolyl isomerase [Photobacterium sp. 1_MG-2023]QUJ68412.1 peptidylprolyl isomerase [Photobacterium sp. GJ3]